MTQLDKRKERIESRLSRGLPDIDYSGYVSLLREQRSRNPYHQKEYDGVPRTDLRSLPISHALLEVSNGGYSYNGVIKTDKNIYKPIFSNEMLNDEVIVNDFYKMNSLEGTSDDNLYYEFIKSDSGTNLRSWKYLYIPISSSVEELIRSKLPFIPTYSTDPISYYKKTPSELYLLSTGLYTLNKYYEMEVIDYSHPFLPNFYFTGKVGQQSDGSLLYQYFDSIGYWGPQDDLYLSPLRPVGLDFPLGYYDLSEVENDACFKSGEYPKRGELHNLGVSLGVKTNSRYNPLKEFYLYEREDGSSILLDTKETVPYSTDFIDHIKISLGLLSSSIQLVSTDNTGFISLNQDSLSNQVIQLG